jgi:hypothetical protein
LSCTLGLPRRACGRIGDASIHTSRPRVANGLSVKSSSLSVLSRDSRGRALAVDSDTALVGIASRKGRRPGGEVRFPSNHTWATLRVGVHRSIIGSRSIGEPLPLSLRVPDRDVPVPGPSCARICRSDGPPSRAPGGPPARPAPTVASDCFPSSFYSRFCLHPSLAGMTLSGSPVDAKSLVVVEVQAVGAMR